MRIKATLSLLLAVCLISFKHEYHVSITQLDYNTESNTIQLAMKLHNEDVEFLIKKNLEGPLNLEKDIEKEEVIDFLHKYIKTSFSITSQEVSVDYKFVGKEFEDDDLWIYMETEKFDEMPDIEVKNTLFLELFHDQNNMVHYSKDNQVVQSAVMNKQKRTHSFKLK